MNPIELIDNLFDSEPIELLCIICGVAGEARVKSELRAIDAERVNLTFKGSSKFNTNEIDIFKYSLVSIQLKQSQDFLKNEKKSIFCQKSQS